MGQSFGHTNQSPIVVEEQIRLILKQHVFNVDDLVDIILLYAKGAPNDSVDTNKEHPLSMTNGEDTICGNGTVSKPQLLNSNKDTMDNQSIELPSTGTTVCVKVGDEGPNLYGEITEISINSVLVLLDNVSAELMGTQCIIQHRKQIVMDGRRRKCNRFRCRRANIPQPSPHVRSQGQEEMLLICGFIRDENSNSLKKMGSDLCRLMVAFYHRDRLNQFIEKKWNIFEILLYFGHTKFDVIQCQNDFYLNVDSGDKEIDKWFNTKLEQYRVPFRHAEGAGGRTFLAKLQCFRSVTFNNFSNEYTESELARLLQFILGIPDEQIRITHWGRSLQPGANFVPRRNRSMQSLILRGHDR